MSILGEVFNQQLMHQGFCQMSTVQKSDLSQDPLPSNTDNRLQESFSASTKLKKEIVASPLNSRVMLIDGTSIMYRSYYKLLGNF